MSKTEWLRIVLGLTLIGGFLRIFNIQKDSLWLDEACTYILAKDPITYLHQLFSFGEVHPPLFYWLEYIPVVLIGSEVAMRIIPAIFGIVSIPAIYFLGKEICNEKVGIISAILLTFSPFLIYYSQEARMYSMVLFLSIVALYFMAKSIKTKNKTDNILFLVCAVFLAWTHFYSFIFAAIMVVVLLYFNRERKDVFIAFLITSLPLVYVGLGVIFRQSSVINWGQIGITIVISTFGNVFNNVFLIIPFLLLFILGVLTIRKTKEKISTVFITLLLFGFLSSFILSFYVPIVPRYLMFVFPILYVGVAASFDYNKYIRYLLISIVVIFLIFSSVSLFDYYSHPTKDQWRESVKVIEKTIKPGEKIVLIPGYNNIPFKYYYNGDNEIIEIYKVEELEKINCRCYFVFTGDISAIDSTGNIYRWLGTNTIPIWNFRGIMISKNNII